MTALSRARLDVQRPISMPLRGSARLLRAVTLALLLSFSAVATVAAQEDSTPAASPAPAVTPAPDMPRLEIDLEELNDSGIGGTVTLYDAGERVVVEFDVDGAGGDHPARIYEGVCGDMNPEPAYELENIDDEGESTTVVDITLDELLDDNHAIGMHLAPDQLGTLIACADIEGEPEVPEGTPQASPESSPVATPPPDGTGGTQGATIETSDGTGGAEPTAEILEGTTETETETETDTGTGDQQGDAAALDETPTPTPTQPAPTPAPEPEPSPTAVPTEETTPVTSVAGSSSDDTGGTQAGTIESTDGTGGATSATTTTAAGDGTAGVSGKGEPIGGGTSTLPQQAGVGAALAWPETPADAAMWASVAAATVLGGAAVIVRRGEHVPQTTPSRWSRLGI